MSAYADYAIHGTTRRGPVVVGMRAIATPSAEVAAWILKERYPSATFVSVTRAAYDTTIPKYTTVRAKDMAAKPIRRRSK